MLCYENLAIIEIVAAMLEIVERQVWPKLTWVRGQSYLKNLKNNNAHFHLKTKLRTFC